MQRDLIVGYDDSAGSRAALDAAIDLSRELGDRIVIVFGYEPPGGMGEEVVAARNAVRDIGRRIAEDAAAQVKAAGVEVEVKLVDRRPVDALIEVADARDARLIVVGSYGESPIRGAILGSTPHRLLHLADRPVLAVPAT